MSTRKLSPFGLRDFLQASIPSAEWSVKMSDRCPLEVSNKHPIDIPADFVQSLVEPYGWTVWHGSGYILCVPQDFPHSRTIMAQNGLRCAPRG